MQNVLIYIYMYEYNSRNTLCHGRDYFHRPSEGYPLCLVEWFFFWMYMKMVEAMTIQRVFCMYNYVGISLINDTARYE